MNFPEDKKFAFTIIDDTDNSTIENIKPVYDLLTKLGFRTSKSVWVYESRDQFGGSTLQDEDYANYVIGLQKKGFEIFLHSISGGDFKRQEIFDGFEKFNSVFGNYPRLYANHSLSKNNIYFEPRYRFVSPIGDILNYIQNIIRSGRKKGFWGQDPKSEYFWGDLCKEKVEYLRNLTFNNLNLLKVDPQIPYRIKKMQKYANYSFSASDGHTVEEFVDITKKENVDLLVKERGATIIYTHFASGFMNNGKLNEDFIKNMEYIAAQGGWFVPVSELLDYLKTKKENHIAFYPYLFKLNVRWIIGRVLKYIKYSR